jgi:hypothetical protein
MSRLIRGIALMILVCESGCGVYSFSGSSLPSHIKAIAVPVFGNETLEFEVANEATEAVTQRFLQDNRLKLVGESRADCVLEGRIVRYERKVHNYTASQEPEDYIVVVTMAVQLRDISKNRDLWREDAMSTSVTYAAAGGDTVGAPTDERGARQRAVKKLAEDVFVRTMEQW